MVVVIEEQQEDEQQIPTSTTKANKPVPESTSFGNKDESDGFETASDGDGDDDRDEDGDDDEQQQQQIIKDDCYQDALNEDLKQKALAQANDVKVEGNELFKAGKFEEALLKYEEALEAAPEIPKREPSLQAKTETQKDESKPQSEPEKPKNESKPQSEPEKPTPQSEPEKPKNEPAVHVPPEMTPIVELCSICHFNRAVCFLKLGKYEESVKECSKALDLKPVYVKALFRRGEAYEKLERYEDAISDMKKILELDPSNYEARRNIVRLEPLAKEKMEKMKEEMIGKLKDMGNSILGRFGMSVDNFKAVQDPNTGSYSISFQK